MVVFGKIMRVIAGILLVIIGIAALASPTEAFLALSWIWSILLIAGGVANIIAFFAVGNTPGRGFLMFGGIVELILGIMLVSNGILFTATVAFILLQIWIIFAGIQGIVVAIELKGEGVRGWWTSLIFGILCLILGLLTFASAFAGTTLVGVFVGIGLIVSGITLVTNGFSKKEE